MAHVAFYEDGKEKGEGWAIKGGSEKDRNTLINDDGYPVKKISVCCRPSVKVLLSVRSVAVGPVRRSAFLIRCRLPGPSGSRCLSVVPSFGPLLLVCLACFRSGPVVGQGLVVRSVAPSFVPVKVFRVVSVRLPERRQRKGEGGP